MKDAIDILLDAVASSTKAVSMLNMNSGASISVETDREKVTIPSSLYHEILDLLKGYVEKKKDEVKKMMEIDH